MRIFLLPTTGACEPGRRVCLYEPSAPPAAAIAAANAGPHRAEHPPEVVTVTVATASESEGKAGSLAVTPSASSGHGLPPMATSAKVAATGAASVGDVGSCFDAAPGVNVGAAERATVGFSAGVYTPAVHAA